MTVPDPAPEPRDEDQEIVLRLGDILPRVPGHLLKPGPHDPKAPIRFSVDELAEKIARGRVSVPLDRLAALCPDVFRSAEDFPISQEIQLPLQKLLEQVGLVAPKPPVPNGMSADQFDQARTQAGFIIESAGSPQPEPPPQMPRPPVTPPAALPVAPPLTPPQTQSQAPSQPSSPAPRARGFFSGRGLFGLFGRSKSAPAPLPATTAAPTPKTEPSPESKPAPPEEKSVTPPPSGPIAESIAKISTEPPPPPANSISVRVLPILRLLPGDVLRSPTLPAEAGQARVSLPLSAIEPQLAAGHVEIPLADFTKALAPNLRQILNPVPDTKVWIPLDEIFQNLPPDHLYYMPPLDPTPAPIEPAPPPVDQPPNSEAVPPEPPAPIIEEPAKPDPEIAEPPAPPIAEAAKSEAAIPESPLPPVEEPAKAEVPTPEPVAAEIPVPPLEAPVKSEVAPPEPPAPPIEEPANPEPPAAEAPAPILEAPAKPEPATRETLAPLIEEPDSTEPQAAEAPTPVPEAPAKPEATAPEPSAPPAEEPAPSESAAPEPPSAPTTPPAPPKSAAPEPPLTPADTPQRAPWMRGFQIAPPRLFTQVPQPLQPAGTDAPAPSSPPPASAPPAPAPTPEARRTADFLASQPGIFAAAAFVEGAVFASSDFPRKPDLDTLRDFMGSFVGHAREAGQRLGWNGLLTIACDQFYLTAVVRDRHFIVALHHDRLLASSSHDALLSAADDLNKANSIGHQP